MRLSDILFRVLKRLALGILILIAAICVRAGGNVRQQQSAASSQSAQNPPAANQQPSQPQNVSAPPPQPLPEVLQTVVIDPGHGGADTGARGSSGVEEKDVVMDLARDVTAALRARGFNVVMTRIAEVDPSFDERATVANAQKDAVFISLHVGSAGPANTVRTYTYLFPSASPPPFSLGAVPASGFSRPVSAPSNFVPWREAQQPFLVQSRKLGDLIQVELAQKFTGSPEISSNVPVAVLRSVTAPAVAVEISNISEDQQKLEDMGADLGDGIARAVVAYRSVYPPGGRQ